MPDPAVEWIIVRRALRACTGSALVYGPGAIVGSLFAADHATAQAEGEARYLRRGYAILVVSVASWNCSTFDERNRYTGAFDPPDETKEQKRARARIRFTGRKARRRREDDARRSGRANEGDAQAEGHATRRRA